jgi:hypothetical protein
MNGRRIMMIRIPEALIWQWLSCELVGTLIALLAQMGMESAPFM